MAKVAPPRLSLFNINDAQAAPDIVIEQQFKPNPNWGVSVGGSQPQPHHPGHTSSQDDVLRQRVAEWRATCHTDANAAHNLGIALFRGEGVQKDLPSSVKMFSFAAKMGNVNSAFNLGWMFTNGTSVKQSWPQAVKWWSFAAHNGHASAARNVGLLYSLGIVPEENGEAKVNHDRAVYFYKMSCELGNAKAHLALAQNYRQGLGVAKDEAKAIELEERAAVLQRQQQLNPPDEGGGL